MLNLRNLKKIGACGLLLALLAGAVSPKVGDFIELQRSLTGLASSDFSDEEANAKFIIEAHALGRIDRVKPLVGGTYGLLITIRTGSKRGRHAWIDYNPSRGYVALCSVDLDACPVARDLLEAQAVRTEVPMPALPASEVPAAAEADPWAHIPPPNQASQASFLRSSGLRSSGPPSSGSPSSGLATLGAGFIPEASPGTLDDGPYPAVAPQPPDDSAGSAGSTDAGARIARWVNRHINDPSRLTGAPEVPCQRVAPVSPPPHVAMHRSACYNLSPEYQNTFQSNPDFRKRDGRYRKQAFLDYIGPIAVQVQQFTRIPASVLIAQAALESGWGTSNLAVNGHDLFGITCSTRGERTRYPIREYGDHGDWSYTWGRCDARFPRNNGERGGHVSFNHTYESVYAYASTLLATGYYPHIRATISRTPAFQAASWKEVVRGLGPYSVRGYGYQVASLIRSNNLEWYDHIQLCGP